MIAPSSALGHGALHNGAILAAGAGDFVHGAFLSCGSSPRGMMPTAAEHIGPEVQEQSQRKAAIAAEDLDTRFDTLADGQS